MQRGSGAPKGVVGLGEHLYEALAKGGVLVSKEALRDVRVGHLQKPELRLQRQTDSLLSQQRPAHPAPRPSGGQ